ncbi:flagellar hook-length control protein FliK [Vibrio xiamenensis]|uniref:Flagellar hook-length control protein FliK n=1 Tax=Vibrio xiamenensis TaxID=861298 RepID=A0A1G8D412_9VIBR|nr:flagellar hook-length control protein FliK [Vibrio xiamenensis]SDH52537.1 flagellar hook-length control protein FliK [Vibrio xiamenensis]
MNVNLMPSSESSKLTKASSEVESSAKESESHDGFFAKLMSLVTGEHSREASKAAGDAVDKLHSGEGDAEVAKGESAPEGKVISEDKVASEGDESEQALLEQADGDRLVAAESSEEQQDSEKILAKGGEILERLGEANRALQKGGKTLPLEDDAEQEISELKGLPESAKAFIQGQVASSKAASSTDSAKSDGKISEQELTDEDKPDSMAGVEVLGKNIVWGASDDAKASKDASISKDGQSIKAPSATPVAGSVAQALAAAQPEKPGQQAAINAELNGAQLTTVQGEKATAAVEGEALKAALGKSMTANLGKNVQAEKLATAALGQDDSFANQLAHAAGHQGQSNALNPLMRADQTAAAQQPLVLQRDMAGEQLAERVQMMLSKNLKNIDIRLDPPELGRLHIRMNMNGDAASVQFTVSNPQARDMIEQSMPRLREMLTQQGLQLADTSVQQQSAGQQQSSYAQQGNGSESGELATNTAVGDENLDANVKVDVNVATKRDGISYYA